MNIPIERIIERLEQLIEKIHGCGNGRNEVDRFTKELKRELTAYQNDNSNTN